MCRVSKQMTYWLLDNRINHSLLMYIYLMHTDRSDIEHLKGIFSDLKYITIGQANQQAFSSNLLRKITNLRTNQAS